MPLCLGPTCWCPVDIYIPGCPPRPEGFIQGILALEDKITGGEKKNYLRRFRRMGGKS